MARSQRHAPPPHVAPGPLRHRRAGRRGAPLRGLPGHEPARRSGRSCRSGPPATATRPTSASRRSPATPCWSASSAWPRRGCSTQRDLETTPAFPRPRRLRRGHRSSSGRCSRKAFDASRRRRRRAARGAFSPSATRKRPWLDDFALFMALKDAHGGGASGTPGTRTSSRGEPEALAARSPSARGARSAAVAVRPVPLLRAVGGRARRGRARGDPHRWATSRSSWPTTAPTSGPTPSSSTSPPTASPAFVAGVPARLLQRHRPALGQPALSLGRAGQRPATPWWIDRFRAVLSTGRHRAARPLPRLRGVLGGAREGGDRRERPLGQGPRGSLLRGAPGGARAPARSSPRTWASSRPRSRRCASASAGPAWPSCSSPSERRRGRRASCPTTTRETAWSTPGPTTTTRRWAGGRRRRGLHAQRRARSTRSGPSARRYLGGDGREIHWDFIRAVLMSVADTAIVPLQDVLGRGRRGAHEPARPRRAATGCGATGPRPSPPRSGTGSAIWPACTAARVPEGLS